METINEPTLTKARKQHSCDLCWQPIEVGSTYLNAVYKHDYIYSWKMHKHCNEIAVKLKMYDDYEDGLDSDSFKEQIDNEFYNISTKSEEENEEMTYSQRLNFVLEQHNLKTE